MDAKTLLDQMLGAGKQHMEKSGYAGQGKGLATGALAGSVIGLLLGNKKARKFGGKAATYGGLAVVAGLAWKAWQQHQASSTGTAPPPEAARGQPALPPPRESPFHPDLAPEGPETLARSLLVAMIAAAKADGHVDAEEQRRIFARLDDFALDAEDKAFVMDELRAPLDLDRVVRLAKTPEQATEIYAASLLAMDPDSPAERAWLDLLAARLSLPAALAGELEAAAKEAVL